MMAHLRGAVKRCLSCVLAATLSLVDPSLNSAHAQSLQETLARLREGRNPARNVALERLHAIGDSQHFEVCSPATPMAIKSALIEALVIENRHVQLNSPAVPASDAEDFYPNIIDCVGGFRDAAATTALLGAINTGGMAIAGLVVIGDSAVPAIARALRNYHNSWATRAAVAMTLRQMASDQAPARLSTTSYHTVRSSLLAALEDSSSLVRADVIEALDPFSDQEIRSRIAAIALTDTATLVAWGKRVYIVRRSAQAWMRRDSLRAKR